MTAVDQLGVQVPPRSTFVTVVAWIFIVLGGFATLIGGLQNLMIRSMPFDQLNSVLQDSTAAAIPAPARFMFAHFQLFFLATFVLSLLMLISAIGLLRRHNWARLTFMGLLVLGIVYMLGGLFVQQSFMASVDASLNGATPQDSVFRGNVEQFQSMFTAMRVFMIVFSVGMAGVFAWIVARLASAKTRAEFVSHITQRGQS